MKVLFMGTPDFAVPTLEKIIENGHEVSLVVTQPDKIKGRGGKVSFSPVKECAMSHDIPVFQPVKVRENENIDELKKYEFDVIVVVAFGQILPKEILDLPRLGCINVHSSLLPSYRGAAPIQWTIINGEEKTGVTIMYMDEGIDTGDIILQEMTDIRNDDTGETLHDRLADMGANLLVKALPMLETGTVERIKQDESKSNYVGMLSKDMGNIDFNKSASEIDRLVRGLYPWPSAYTYVEGKLLKIFDVAVLDDFDEGAKDLKNGTVSYVDKHEFHIKVADGTLDVREVQLQGKKRMDTDSFLRGFKIEVGMVFGE